MNQSRREIVKGGVPALASLLTGAVLASAASANAEAKSDVMTGSRIFTDANGNSHVGPFTLNAASPKDPAHSLVPAGCTAYYEGPAISFTVFGRPPNFDIDYHTMPAGQHMVAFHAEGKMTANCKDGTAVHLTKPELYFLEADRGTGYDTHSGDKGFLEIFVFVPA